MFASVSATAVCNGSQSTAAERPVPRLSMINTSWFCRSGPNSARYSLRDPVAG